jgi:hypothetical protein
MEPRRVLLLGKSVILGTVGASLQKWPEFEVIALSPPFPSTKELEAVAPDVILFDIQAVRPDAAFDLLETCPGLLLVGVNPDRNEVRMWSGQQLSELSTQDLVQAITSKLT